MEFLLFEILCFIANTRGNNLNSIVQCVLIFLRHVFWYNNYEERCVPPRLFKISSNEYLSIISKDFYVRVKLLKGKLK